MHHLWYLTLAAAIFAAHHAWQRRHLWRTSHALPAKTALALGTGLVLISPIGEPWGDLMHDLMWMHNIEDFQGHFLILAGATLMLHRALLTLGWNDQYLHRSAIAVAILICVIGAATKTVLTPSDATNPADTGYWMWTSVVLAPAFAIAAFAHLVIAVEHHQHRVLAITHAAPLVVGFAGCVARPIPAIPVMVTYWCYTICLIGLCVAGQMAWQRIWAKPLRALQSL